MNRRSLFKKLGAAAAAVAVAPALVTEAAEDTRAVVLDAEPTEATTREWVFRPETDTTIVVNTHSYVAWQVEPLTFDDLAAGCGANGCHLERTYDIVRLRYEYAHWRDGDLWPDDTMTARGRDIEPVAAWLDGLHEREARRAGEELAGAVDDLATRTNPGAAMLTIEDFRNAVRMLDTNTFAAEAAGTSTFTLLPSHYGVEGQA